MRNEISLEILISRKESAQRSQRILYDLCAVLAKDSDLNDRLSDIIKCDAKEYLHKADMDLRDYEDVINSVIHSTQITWPPEITKK